MCVWGLALALLFPIICSGFVGGNSALPTRRSLATRESSSSSNEGEDNAFSEDLIESLDLIPLVKGVADHAGTRRGRQALLSLVREDVDHRFLQSNDTPAHRRRVTERRGFASTQRHSELVSLASSAEEARREYELVEQALLALSPEGIEDDGKDLTYPPIYGANSSPEDTSTRPETDDDDWMWLPVDELTLEHVLQADQVVRTLLKVKEWSQQPSVSTWLPDLSEIGLQIPEEHLLPVLEEIGDAVEIARVRSLTDPNGRSSFLFRLKDGKFPNLENMRLQERELVDTIDREMKIILRKTKGSPEYVDHDGRKVLLIPKASATSDVGLVRGTEEGRCYVEPRSVVEWGDELAVVRGNLEAAEAALEHDLIQTILRAQTVIDASLHIMARLDTIFARAAFGKRMKGSIPKISTAGCLSVERFVHPVLALEDLESVVPTDLHLANKEDEAMARCLVVSGPNGGGKSVAMKSFGLACLLTHMAIPVPHRSSVTPRIDFFPQVLVELGDQQDVLEGESTFMAKLNSCSSLIEQVQSETGSTNTLILLDEIGSGTDPAAGGAIGQAIMEKLLENDACRIVATTHSPRLKALSFGDDMYECATVLLKRGEGDYKVPTFQLQYGLIGDSYALGAASRADPSLPKDVIARAASLLASSESSSSADDEGGGELLQALTNSLEMQVEESELALRQASQVRDEASDCRDAMVGMARAYENRFEEILERMESMVKDLENDEDNTLEVVGNTLATLRVAKKKAKTEVELLREQGLKPVSSWYEFVGGETVVIVASGPWEGTSATVAESQGPDTVLVVPESSWEYTDSSTEKPMLFPRHELAVWDYDSVWDEAPMPTGAPSVRESKRRLGDVLSSIGSSASSTSKTPTTSKFISSRQRKAASSGKKKAKKRKRK